MFLFDLPNSQNASVFTLEHAKHISSKTLFLVFSSWLTLLNFQQPAEASEFWTGPDLSFSKPSNADWNLAVYQDRITNDVWLTRASTQGLFNIAPNQETAYTDPISPINTEWAYGSIFGDVHQLTFKHWKDTVGSNPTTSLNKDMVLHLISDDIFIGIKFLSFQGGGIGGAFSYIRSTPTIASTPVPLPNIGFWLFGCIFATFLGRFRGNNS
jgi:hypothetical protein